MGASPRMGRRPIRSFFRSDVIRGAVCALLMVALALRDLPLPMVLVLPLLTYAGLRLIAASRTGQTAYPTHHLSHTQDEVLDREPHGSIPELPTANPVAVRGGNGLATDILGGFGAQEPAPAKEIVGHSGREGEARALTRVQGDRADRAEVPAGRLDQPRPGDAAAAATLTPRELDVLRLLALGRSNKEIAAELFISVLTVKTHVQNILLKLGLPSRSAAAAYAHQHDLV